MVCSGHEELRDKVIAHFSLPRRAGLRLLRPRNDVVDNEMLDARVATSRV